MLKDAHQEVPPELERYAFSSGGGNYGNRYGSRYSTHGMYGMTGSNNVPLGRSQ